MTLFFTVSCSPWYIMFWEVYSEMWCGERHCSTHVLSTLPVCMCAHMRAGGCPPHYSRSTVSSLLPHIHHPHFHYLQLIRARSKGTYTHLSLPILLQLHHCYSLSRGCMGTKRPLLKWPHIADMSHWYGRAAGVLSRDRHGWNVLIGFWVKFGSDALW